MHSMPVTWNYFCETVLWNFSLECYNQTSPNGLAFHYFRFTYKWINIQKWQKINIQMCSDVNPNRNPNNWNHCSVLWNKALFDSSELIIFLIRHMLSCLIPEVLISGYFKVKILAITECIYWNIKYIQWEWDHDCCVNVEVKMHIILQSQSFFLFNLRVKCLCIAYTGSRRQLEVTLIIKGVHGLVEKVIILKKLPHSLLELISERRERRVLVKLGDVSSSLPPQAGMSVRGSEGLKHFLLPWWNHLQAGTWVHLAQWLTHQIRGRYKEWNKALWCE